MFFSLLIFVQTELCHPVWGRMDNYSLGREKRKQLLIMLCQHEADRLEVWSQPLNMKYGFCHAYIFVCLSFVFLFIAESYLDYHHIMPLFVTFQREHIFTF